ncbi:YjcZ family sporulation protein [Bacillus cereus]
MFILLIIVGAACFCYTNYR